MSWRKYLYLPYASDRFFGFLFLALVMGTLVLVPGFNDPIETPKFAFWSLLLGLALLFARNRLVSIKLPKPTLIVLGLVLVWALVATIVSFDHVNSTFGILGRMTNSLWFFAVLVSWIVALSTISREQFLFLLKVVGFLGGLIAVYAIAQNFGWGYYPGLTDKVRWFIPSFLGNPNFVAMYLAVTLVLLLWLGWQSGRLGRVFWLVIGAVHVWAMVIMASRGAILALLAGLVVWGLFVLWQKNWRLLIAAFSVFVVVSGLNVVYLQSVRPEGLVAQGPDESATLRYLVWNNVFEFVKQRPLTGSGLANYFIAYRQTQTNELANTTWFDDPHNIFMHLSVTGGLPLAGFFLLLVSLTLWYGQRAFRREKSLVLATLLSALIVWILASLFNPVSMANWILFGVLIAGIYQTIGQPITTLANKIMKIFILAFASIFILLAMGFLVSDFFLMRAQVLSQSKYSEKVEQYSYWATVANPSSTAAWVAHSVASLINKNYDTAAGSTEFLAELHPRSALTLQIVYSRYYFLYKETGDPKYLEQYYETLTKYQSANPNYFTTYQDLTFAYTSIKDTDHALSAARKFVVLSEGNHKAWAALARVYQLQNDKEKMLSALTKAYEANPYPPLRLYISTMRTETDPHKIPIPYPFPEF